MEDDGWKVKYVDDAKEIGFVFDELKKSPITYSPQTEITADIREVLVRRGDGAVLLRVRQEWDGKKFVLKHNTTYLELTDELNELFNKRFLEVD